MYNMLPARQPEIVQPPHTQLPARCDQLQAVQPHVPGHVHVYSPLDTLRRYQAFLQSEGTRGAAGVSASTAAVLQQHVAQAVSAAEQRQQTQTFGGHSAAMHHLSSPLQKSVMQQQLQQARDMVAAAQAHMLPHNNTGLGAGPSVYADCFRAAAGATSSVVADASKLQVLGCGGASAGFCGGANVAARVVDARQNYSISCTALEQEYKEIQQRRVIGK